MNKKLYHLRCADGDLGRYNATYIYDRYVIASSESSAIYSVLNNRTYSVEVLSVNDFVDVD